MATRNETSRGAELERRLQDGVREVAAAPLPGTRELPVLRGMTKRGEFTDPVENVTLRAIEFLAASRRVYAYGNDVAMEVTGGIGERLVTLCGQRSVVSEAADLLANLFVCEHASKRDSVQFPPPRHLVDHVLRSELLPPRLPRVRLYSRTPLFDADYAFCGPGWHEASGVLVHGPAVEPAPFTPADPGRTAIDRLPPHLRRLLAGFCFASASDAANLVAALVTGLLVNHFLTTPKPVLLLDGNQPGTGKSLLARALGVVLAGADPRLIHYTADDDDLAKRICANLRGGQAGVLVIDNAKVRSDAPIDSTVIESQSMAPEISMRVLGVSENYARPNDVLWVLTMNATQASADLVSRALPVRLAYEGDPAYRVFAGPDPVEYAREHRGEILGELAGMVDYWVGAGRTDGHARHRCGHWARVVGGVMEAAGLPEFLGNAGEAAAAFSADLVELAALADGAVAHGGAACETPGMPANAWEVIFQRAGVLRNEFQAGTNSRARSTRIGQFMTPLVGRTVTITNSERTGRATLRVTNARSRAKTYFFEVVWDEELPATPPDPGSDAGPTAELPGSPAVSTGGNTETWGQPR